jgi:ankyrin repeat protein
MFSNHTHSHGGNKSCNHSHHDAFKLDEKLSVGFNDENIVVNTTPSFVNNEKKKEEDLLKNQIELAKKKEKELEHIKIQEAIARKDYSDLDAVKATQFGVLERVKELVENNKVNPLKPDNDNIYLLHWAAYNNRLDIAQYLISLGCKVDQIGGELETTPLNWAARSGHVQTVAYLMKQEADPNARDNDGFSSIHLASMNCHSMVVAYLLAKGVQVNIFF